jgi:hypothetical protein
MKRQEPVRLIVVQTATFRKGGESEVTPRPDLLRSYSKLL